MTGRPLRVLVADDHPLFREGLRKLLDEAGDLEWAGEAADGAAAVRLAVERDADVVLMDLRMPELNGVEATRRILAERGDVRILVLTMFEDDDSVFAAVRAGARGYILKGSGEAEVLRAIRAVGAGEAIFGESIASRLVSYFSSKRSSPFSQLTARETEVLELIAGGRSNQAIANELGLNLKTVRNHVSSIFNKLRVVDRAEAIAKAREAGVGSPRG